MPQTLDLPGLLQEKCKRLPLAACCALSPGAARRCFKRFSSTRLAAGTARCRSLRPSLKECHPTPPDDSRRMSSNWCSLN